MRETLVSATENPLVFEAGVSQKFFPFENCVCISMEYTLSVSNFRWAKHSLHGT
jgi:hypothetical protein